MRRAGEGSALERICFQRSGGAWGVSGGPERVATRVPPVRARLFRDPREEGRARAAAEAFIADADGARFDGAWDRTSAVLKAVLSRETFEQHLQQRLARTGERRGGLYLSFEAPPGRFVPGASIAAWLGRATVDGPVVEVLTLRLDDDLEWRVSNLVDLGAAPQLPVSPQGPEGVSTEI